ncbi:MAG: GNAT family N-acetyltransferase [Myxococcales bacterium]|nr:MAG: GNAT family N-acetyltransferase [Myxococcales bacterium]
MPRPMHRTRAMRPTYRITTARSADVPFLSVIELAAGGLLAPYAPEPVLKETTPEPRFREALQAGRLWVALTSETPVGFAHVELLPSGLPHLEQVGVHPSHGRQGLGTRLVTAVCDWAERQRHARLTLTTFRDAPFNMPFYAKLGFTELPAEELEQELTALVAEEASRGLDPMRRVVMRWERSVRADA